MRIERIAQNKIKVTLSNDDLLEWDISFESLTYNSPQAQELFWDLMKRAEEEAGFFADGSQLVVEAMPTRNDGFIMLITKVEEGDESPLKKLVKPKSKREFKTKKQKYSISPIVFEFDAFNDVVEACKNIENRFIGNSSLYKKDGKFFLVLDVDNEYLAEDLKLLLTEFAKKVDNSFVKEGELFEHAEMLIKESAVENFNSYF